VIFTHAWVESMYSQYVSLCTVSKLKDVEVRICLAKEKRRK